MDFVYVIFKYFFYLLCRDIIFNYISMCGLRREGGGGILNFLYLYILKLLKKVLDFFEKNFWICVCIEDG